MREEKHGGVGASATPFLTLGLQLAISIVLFFFMGRWLDEYLDTAPWFSLVGAALGITGGMIKFIKSAIDLGKGADEEFKKTRHGERHED